MTHISCPKCAATGSTINGLHCYNCGTYIGVGKEPKSTDAEIQETMADTEEDFRTRRDNRVEQSILGAY
ncbi:MAG TPA: hypothetical protein VHQ41_02330 [Patescibacteria group bacterium]|jgi:hypothetical protein|nr:hypothetical protein [Patescibacteria group bacterium]